MYNIYLKCISYTIQVYNKSIITNFYFQITDKLCCAVLRQNTNQFEYDCLATDVVKFLLHNQKLIFVPIKTDSILSEKFNFFDSDDNFYKVSVILILYFTILA
jgi:hypothetical protein